ncbi:unannotated protein [freshwater metagenome]|uniref:Unannotated protein n=1 Tax=freshwater metagenome TaxID=449393 RepID=A0A6J7JTJ0_9ZZZZ
MGAFQVRAMVPLPATPAKAVGVPGTVSGVTEVEGMLALESPIEFWAITVTV